MLAHVANGWSWTDARYAISPLKEGNSPNLSGITGQANHFRVFGSVKSEYGIKRYIDETKRLFSVLETRLQESPYLAGPKYTIADIASYSWVRSAPGMLDIDLSEWPALKKWVDTISQRPAVQKGLNIPPRGFTEEQFSQFLKAARERMDLRENTDKH
jgi:glutathione S-transferase